MYWAIIQRARKVAVSSQRVSSQPETFGGMNRYWPAPSHSHAQSPVSTPRPTARSIPATCTTGGLTIRGPEYRSGCMRIASSSGRTSNPR